MKVNTVMIRNYKNNTVRSLLQPDCRYFPYLADAHRAMNDVENFNVFGSNAVDNQMGVEYYVAIHAASGGNVATRRIRQIKYWKRFNLIYYFPVVTFCLQVAESFITKVIYLVNTFVELAAYFNLLARYSFFHALCLLSNSPKVIKFPVSIR